MGQIVTGLEQWIISFRPASGDGRTIPTVNELLNRGLSDSVRIRMKIWWPLLLFPLLLFSQIFAPHPVWVVFLVILGGLYGIGYVWVRSLALRVTLMRERIGTILVAGDLLREEFELRNESHFPVLWAEFVDESDLPGYTPGRVVACGPDSFYRWKTEVECSQRGVFRLGPHRLFFGEPFGLYTVEVRFSHADMVLIYPRVARLPHFELPHGNAGGVDRRRRPLPGTVPSASITDYRPGDSLRHIHWRTTAHRGRLTVKELEIEPSGDVWIVLDLNREVHRGTGRAGTLEYAIIVAASLAAELLSGSERRAVGLLAMSGGAVAVTDQDNELLDRTGGLDRQQRLSPVPANDLSAAASETGTPVLLTPQPGQAQLWQILAALAPVRASDVSLADLLFSNREVLGRRRTLVVITPQTSSQTLGSMNEQLAMDGAMADVSAVPELADGRHTNNWLAELLHLQTTGLASSVLIIAPPIEEEAGKEAGDGPDAINCERFWRVMIYRRQLSGLAVRCNRY